MKVNLIYLDDVGEYIVEEKELSSQEIVDLAYTDGKLIKIISPDIKVKGKIKIEVLGVKGNENRLEIARKVAGKYFSENPGNSIDLKKPDYLVTYIKDKVGVDITGDISSRYFRLFKHPSGYKGEFAAHVVETSKYKPGEKVLVCFIKDSSLLIEYACYSHKVQFENLPLMSLPEFEKCNVPEEKFNEVEGLELNRSNIIRSIKNLKTLNFYAKIHRNFELDKFDLITVMLGRGEENYLDEILNMNFDKMTILTRSNLLLPIPEKYEILERGVLSRGDQIINYVNIKS